MVKQRFDRNRDWRNQGWREAEDQPTPVVCKAQSYARFNCWLNGELAKLERRWQHTAAPAARNPLSRVAPAGLVSSRIPKTKPKPK